MRQMHFVAFLQAQNCTTLPASWHHPEARTDTDAPEYSQHIARVLEAGTFDMGFFDDRLAMPDLYGGDHAHTAQYGIRCVKLDPIACLMTMAAPPRGWVWGRPPPRSLTSRSLSRASSRRPHRLERGHLGERQRNPQYGPHGGDGAR
jgi:hypothetical protein